MKCSVPPVAAAAAAGLVVIYKASGCGFCCCEWERVSRRLVGHWVLLSRFGSNGMGPRVGRWAPGERGPDKI